MPLVTMMSVSARQNSTGLTPQVVIDTILEEFHRRKYNNDDGDAVVVAAAHTNKKMSRNQGSGEPSTSASGTSKQDVKCFFCKKKGHYKRDCRFRKKALSEKDGKQDSKQANAAVEDKPVAFAVITGNAALRGTIKENIDVFNSAASCHMTPRKDRFVSFKELKPPKTIRVADEMTIQATDVGQMHIHLPNGDNTTPVVLNEVLYSEDLAFTLISLTKLDKVGYSALLKNEKCTLFNDDGKTLGCIAMDANRLYAVRDQGEFAAAMLKTYTIDEIHAWLGHIGEGAIKRLLKEGTVSRLKVDKKSKFTFCKACAEAKASKEPVPTERKGTRCRVRIRYAEYRESNRDREVYKK
jgi:hypothetical protein